MIKVELEFGTPQEAAAYLAAMPQQSQPQQPQQSAPQQSAPDKLTEQQLKHLASECVRISNLGPDKGELVAVLCKELGLSRISETSPAQFDAVNLRLGEIQ